MEIDGFSFLFGFVLGGLNGFAIGFAYRVLLHADDTESKDSDSGECNQSSSFCDQGAWTDA